MLIHCNIVLVLESVFQSFVSQIAHKSMLLFIYLISVLFMAAPSFLYAGKGTVAIIYNQDNSTLSFTANEMKNNVGKAGYSVILSDVKNLQAVKAQTRIILTIAGDAQFDEFTKNGVTDITPESVPGAYVVKERIFIGYKDWCITGSDRAGTIYGGLDVSETVRLKGLNALTEVSRKPYIASRGIKFNIPLDARTPSYSDNADAAQKNIANMWDAGFWHEFLDEMARDRFNMLSLWSLSPFPSLVDVAEYPKAGLEDVKRTTTRVAASTDGWYMSTSASLANLVTIKKLTLRQKIAFWKDVMQYASDRGINCYLFTWNVFTYGTENSGYGLTDKITDAKTKDYIRKATKALIETYPLLKGIGLTAGENMYRLPEADKEKFLFESYGEGINDALATDTARRFQLIHRAHQADINIIKTAFAGLSSNCVMSFSYKYSVAQMYSSTAPKYIYESQFLQHIGDSKFFLTVPDDAWYFLRGGSDPAFARDYLKNIPKKNFEGFYLGPDEYTWGREYISRTPASTNQLILKKRWYSFRMFGKLAYNPDIPDSHFTELIAERFPLINAAKVAAAWAKGSQVMPLINRFHNENAQNDFQWYPEGCTSFYGFRTIENFILSGPKKGEGLMSIHEYTKAFLNNMKMTGATPLDVAAKLYKTGSEALLLVAGMTNVKDRELHETISDIRAMSYLGQYYSSKILGATFKNLYDYTTDKLQKAKYMGLAIKNLQQASNNWKKYADQVTNSYIPQYLTRMHFTIDFKAMQANVDNEVSMLKNKLPEGELDTGLRQQRLEVVFSPYSDYYFWHLDKLNLPANWSTSKCLVLQLYSTSSQPFDLFLQTSAASLVKKDIKPVKGGWTNVVIPVEAFMSQKLSNAQTITNAIEGKTGELKEVLALGVSMKKPVAYPVLSIRSIKLTNEDVVKITAYSPVHP